MCASISRAAGTVFNDRFDREDFLAFGELDGTRGFRPSAHPLRQMLSSTFAARNDICLADHRRASACLRKYHHVRPRVPARSSLVTDAP